MCGTVESCPCIIDLDTQETFRWVIMTAANEASIVAETRNGMALPYNGKDWTVYICKAIPPGHNFILGGSWPLTRFFVGDVPLIATTVHGHPPAPSQPSQAANLAPIPKILPAQSHEYEQVSESETEVEEEYTAASKKASLT
jgi:hypothetical protein